MSDKTEGERIAVLETKVESLHEWAEDLSRSIKEGAETTNKALERLILAVTELATIKTDHERHSTEILNIRRRQHELGNELGRLDQHDIKLGYMDRDLGALKTAVELIKNALPNMELASGWVFKLALWVMAGLGTVALAVIINGLTGG